MINTNNKMNAFFSKVYLWMFIGLLISGAVAYYTSITPGLLKFVYSYYYLLIIIELIVVIVFSAIRRKVSVNVAKILFIIYSLINGLSLTSIFLVYKLGSIAMVFISASLMYGLLALYGFVTKTDLTSMGKMLFMGLIAIVIVSIINAFIQNANISIGLSIISIIIFLGLTAWDMQTLKGIYNYYLYDEKELEKASIYGALDLYLDFINIFIQLLNLFGKSKD